MSSQDFIQIESSQRQHHEEQEHDTRMYAEQLKIDYMLFSLMQPRVFRDGDQWCVLLGANIQDGICGFGNSIHDAVVSFNDEFIKPVKRKKGGGK